MTAKTLDHQMEEYWPLLEKEEKQSILTFIKSFVKQKEAHPQRITLTQYNEEIDEAVKRVEKGEFYTHEEVMEMSKKW